MSIKKQTKKVSNKRQEYLKFKPFADDLRKAESWCELDGVLNRYQTVKNLHKMGYRKTFTSELASDTQKAFKEGYEKAQAEMKAYGEIIKKQDEEISQLRVELLKKEKLEESFNKSVKVIEKKALKTIAKAKTEFAREIFEGIKANCVDSDGYFLHGAFMNFQLDTMKKCTEGEG